MISNSKEWLSPKDLEELYGFSISWQAKARMSSSRSSLPFYKISGKYIRYKNSEIENWLNNHKFR